MLINNKMNPLGDGSAAQGQQKNRTNTLKEEDMEVGNNIELPYV